MNYLKFGNYDNLMLGVRVIQMPNAPIPAERGEAITIPGRNGTLWKSEGAWDNITLAPSFFVPRTANIDAVRSWLTGEGNLELSQGANSFYKARVAGGVEFAPLDFEEGYIGSVSFECYPFRYYKDSVQITLNEPGSIVNSFGVFSEPEITVYGSGDATLTIGGTVFLLDDIVDGMKIDAELQEVYLGAVLYNNKMTGAFPVLAPGSNSISWEGAITQLVIAPRWRML